MKSLFFLSLLISLHSIAQNSKKYTINGYLRGLKDGTVLYLIHNKDEGGPDTVSTVKAKSQKFKFKGILPFEGERYFIKIDTNTIKPTIPIKGYIRFIMESGGISITGNLESLSMDSIKVTGSVTHNEYMEYKNEIDWFVSEQNLLLAKYNTNTDTNAAKILLSQQDYSSELTVKWIKRWINNHPKSLLSPYLIHAAVKWDNLKQKLDAYNLLSEEAQQSKYGIILKDEIRVEQSTEIGAVAPNFTFPTAGEVDLTLNEIIKKGKVTIIDFWASWCGPCRKSFVELKKIYELYNAKGLNIIGFSVDEDKTKWLEAVRKDSLPWYNVRETSKDFAGKTYGVQRLPTTFLVDENGKIIGKDLYGLELEKKLEEIFKKNKIQD